MTAQELEALGDNPTAKINAVINAALHAQPGTVQHRVLSLMSKTTPITVQHLAAAHNVMYASNTVTVEYLRVVVCGMLKVGMIKRVKPGRYIK